MRIINRGQEMRRVISGLARDFNNEWRGGEGRKICARSTYFIRTHVQQTRKDYTKKIHYLSFAWPELRLNGVMFFLLLELFHSAPLLSLY